MNRSALSVFAALFVSACVWTVLAPAPTLANQHAPAGSFAVAAESVEILVERVAGPMTVGGFKVIDLLQVPPDRSLVITDMQVRAGGFGAFLLRNGQRVAEASHHTDTSGIFPPPVAARSASTVGIEFGPRSLVQLQLPAGYQSEFMSFRGYYQTNGPVLVTIHVP